MNQLNIISRISVLLIAIATGFFLSDAYAGNDVWSVAGQPNGGAVLKTLVNPATPSTLYACANGGVFKSTDSGATWTLVLPLYNQADDGAIEPENPNTVYVADSDIYKSTDAGSTWTQVENGIDTLPGGEPDPISHVSVDPVNDGTAYAVGLNTGLYKTTNGGQSWSAINTGLTSLISSNAQFGPIIVDPVNSQVLYITVSIQSSSSSDGIYKSTDGGNQWTASVTNVSAADVEVDPNNDAHVFAIINYQVYASTNSGSTWAPLATSPPGAQLLRINPKNSQNLIVTTLAGAIYYSTNSGTSWTLGANNSSFYIEDLAVDPVTPVNLYVSTSAFGLFKSTDGGQTISESDAGLHAVAGLNRMVMGRDGAIYVSSTGSGIFKSTDQGVVWSSVNNGIANNGYSIDVYALLEDPQTPMTLYAGTVGGLFKTADGGANWTLLNNGKTDPYTFSVALDPENSNTVYAGTDTGGVFKSTDGGNSWQSASAGLPADQILALAVNPANSSVVYAGTFAHGLYRSTDDGASWNSDNTGVPIIAAIEAIATDSANAQNVYVSSGNGGFYKSTDGGNTWTSATTGIPLGYTFQNLTVDPTRTATLYAAPLGPFENVYVTTDAGAHWQSITPFGLATSPVSVMVNATAVDPQNPQNLYGAATDGQIYVFTSLTPTAKAGSESTNFNTSLNAQLYGGLSSFTGVLNFAIVTPPAHGTVTITDATSGAFTYAPTNGFSGSDSFSFTVAAAGAVSAPATESITVNLQPQNPPPPSPPPPNSGGGALSLWTLLLLASLAVRRSRLH